MKITATEDNEIQLEDVVNSIVLKSIAGEKIIICMRDSGFEFNYEGKWYFAKKGRVEPFNFKS